MQVRAGGRETELTSAGRRGVREHAVQSDPEVPPYRGRLAARQVAGGARRSHEDLENPEISGYQGPDGRKRGKKDINTS